MTTIHSVVFFVLCSYFVSTSAEVVLQAGSDGETFRVEKIAEGLGVPWGLVFLSPVEVMFTERKGRVGVLNLDTGTVTWLAGVADVSASGQGGLMDVAVAPDFVLGGWIYFTYSKKTGGGAATTLARAKRDQGRLIDWQDLLVTRSAAGTGRHFGSRVTFDGKGHLFFTVGDRGVRENAQDLSTHAGSVLRLGVDGRVPPDNPFVGAARGLPEIWSYGHRNPQGIAYDRGKQRLWLIEHGPRGGDEINLIKPGRNYGWPVISFGKEYWGPIAVGEGTEKAGMEQPSKVYIPSIAPGSLIHYSGKSFSEWEGNLFAGALKLQHLNRIILDAAGKVAGEKRLLESLGRRIRALRESPNGWLYFSTDDGYIYRIRP